MKNNVLLKTETLDVLLALDGKASYTLNIPEYQRIYCWEEKHVIRLLDDIQEHAGKTYHMGSIILHKKQAENIATYDIVDGQQRLVTLSLLLLHLGKTFPFLEEKFASEQARNYIAHNKWIISNYFQQNNVNESDYELFTNKILKNLSFSVLVLESSHLDLAYTFFTSQNGRGKALSDYDLLKSHHLRYILIPQQAEHLANRWDNMILASDNDDNRNALGRTFEIYLFRLRKWMRKRRWYEYEKRKVKNEFEAAAIIPDIPAFGEQFHFHESIQGGAHFFAYAEHHIHRFNEFALTAPYLALKQHLDKENHWWYRDVIEALLFAYYLKFGTLYLNDACLLITRIISQHRYENYRSYLDSVLVYAGESEIAMMIAQATSPTFFLAEMKTIIKKLPVEPDDLTGTRERYKNHVNVIKGLLKTDSLLTL